MSSTRQLAAIMFTDIVGYTALMGKDEQNAFDLLHKNRQIHKPLIEHYKGKFLKEIGDGILASFPTVTDAVYCAIDILAKSEKEGHYQLRIGIHLGEVVFEKHDVFGDGVNIASRIQAVADVGEILVSESVYRNIANKKGLHVEYLREEYLKNVDTPIKISRVTMKPGYDAESIKGSRNSSSKRSVIILGSLVILLVAGYFLYPVLFTAPPEEKSLAVLPFKTQSDNKEQEFLGDGIAEEILNVLYNTMKDLKVPGRSSSFAFKDKMTDLVTIGKILGVKYILEGTVLMSVDTVNVRVFLSDAKTGYQVRAWRYNKQFKDVLSLQNEIAKDISGELKLSLYEHNLTEEPQAKVEAIEFLLRGNLYFDKGPEGLAKATDYFKKAIASDSTYAYPHVRLGWAIYQATLFGKYPSKTGFELARREIEKGLSLPLSATNKHSAYKALAYINLWNFDWKKAYNEYKNFIAINPKRDDFNAFYESFVLGHTAEGISIHQKIIEENPVDLPKLRDFAILQYVGRQYNDAMRTCDKMLELNPHFSEAFRLKGHIYSAQNKPDSALMFFSESALLENQWGQLLAIITLPRVGKKDEAIKRFTDTEMASPSAIPPMGKALIYYSIGENKKAMEWLNKSYQEKDFWLASLKVDPLWDPMKKDPEFEKIIRKMNFP